MTPTTTKYFSMEVPLALVPCRFRSRITGERCRCNSPRIVPAKDGTVSLRVCTGEAFNLPACKYAEAPDTRQSAPRQPQTQEGNAQKPPKVQRTPRPAGPGTHLKRILSDLGLHGIEGCGCNKRASQMDAWGVSGCREHRAEIVAWLDEQREKSGWWQQLTAGVKAVSAGLWLNPLDVAGSLVDEACRRAESEGESGPS